GLGDAFDHSGVTAGEKFSLLEAVRESAEALDRTCGLLQTAKRKIQLAAIRNAAERVTQRRGFVSFAEEVAQCIEIADRLGHLFAFDEQMFGVQPIPRKWFAGRGFALRDFVLVMRKRKVDTARVNIERFAE